MIWFIIIVSYIILGIIVFHINIIGAIAIFCPFIWKITLVTDAISKWNNCTVSQILWSTEIFHLIIVTIVWESMNFIRCIYDLNIKCDCVTKINKPKWRKETQKYLLDFVWNKILDFENQFWYDVCLLSCF